MFQLFSNKKEGVLSIILDIQSGLVRGALVLNQTQIISVVTKDLTGKSRVLNAEHLTKKTLKLITDVIEHLVKDSQGHHITSIEYILSSPWVYSKLKTVKINYEKETEITAQILENIIKEESKNTTKTADARPIEQKIFEIRLNGYPSITYEGKKAHTLEVSLSTSFSLGSFLDKAHEVVYKYTHIKNSRVHSALLMQYSTLREALKNRNEFIYIHAHSELTDIIIVKDGLCKHIASFPFGIKTLLRKIASVTKGSMESSDSMLSLYQGNKLDETEKARVQKAVFPLVAEWSDQCIASFENIFDITNVPRTIYLSAHSHFDLFKEALVSQNTYNFDINPYDSIDLGNDITFTKGTAQSSMMKIYAFAVHNKV